MIDNERESRAMRIVHNQTFTGVSVVPDETAFLGCTFDNCLLIYCGGDYGWRESTFNPNCKVAFQGPAFRMYEFMKIFGLAKRTAPEAPLPPIVNTSGLVN